jgi:signal transduction histidine kinase/AmiR/NasT family two-component response regulator
MGCPILNPPGPNPLGDFSAEDLKKALHNLQVNQVELEAQNAELRRIQAELDFERDRYFNLYNLAPVGYCTLNQNGFLSEANLTLLTLLKTDKKQISRIPFTRFIHEEDQDLFYKIRRKMFKLPSLSAGADGSTIVDQGFELRMVKLDGSIFWAHLTGVIKQGPGTKEIEIGFIIENITARKTTEESLKQQSELLELTGEMAKVGGWELDISTMRVTWSKETGRLHEVDDNYQAPLMDTGENWYPPEAWPSVKAAVMAAIQFGKPYDMETPFITAKGRRIWVRIQGFPLVVNGKTTKLRGFFQDISDRKQSALDLENAMEAVKNSSIAKSEFLTSMSHEIRTPLNGVLGLTQLLEETHLDAEQGDLVATIKSSGNLLLVLLNDILDFSKIENGKLDIEVLPISIVEILREILKSLANAAKTKGISLVENISDQVPVWLLSDPSRIRQILFNLIGNAIKFTDKGSVTVKVEWKDQVLQFEVMDTGLGIAPDKQGLIFQRFTQADSSTARKFGGSGLGLAISKRLVELMGGEIGLKSEMGQGSNFWFSIPMQEAQAAIAPQADSLHLNPTASDFSQVRILLVEDNLVNQKVAAGMLKNLGCSFELAINGFEALSKSMQTAYDLILMDCEMPEMDGYAATCEIRRLENLDLDLEGKPKVHRRIVALTANALTSDKLRCQASGMDGFLSKPFRKEELGQLIESTFRGWS